MLKTERKFLSPDVHAPTIFTRPALYGAVAALLGAMALTGWLLDVPALTSVRAGWQPMPVNSALCFVLAGCALMIQPLLRSPWRARVRSALSVPLFLVAGTVALEMALDISWIDFSRLQKSRAPDSVHPGQMSPNAVLCFLAVAVLLLLVDRVGNHLTAWAVRILTAIVFAIAYISLLSHVISLEFLYGWAGLTRVALLPACGFVILGFGVRATWRRAPWNTARKDGTEAQRIYWQSDILLAVIAGTVGLTSFALSENWQEKSTADQMTVLAKERRNYFENALMLRMHRAEMMSTRPHLIALVREVQRNGGNARLNASAESYLPHGFSAIAYTAEDGRILGSAGRFADELPDEPDIAVPLTIRNQAGSKHAVELLWKDGFVLHARLPIRDAQGTAGYLMVEQPLPELTKLQSDAIRQGETGDMAVCGLRDGYQLCFPFRWSRKPISLPAYLDGRPLPATRAASGETATLVTLDFRRQRVMAAFGPVGDTGLGLVLKMDTSELYAPIRKQFLQSLPIIALLVAAGVWLMRRRLRPLVRALDESRREQTFIAQHDALTGLPNRALFRDRLEQAIVRARRTKAPIALMYLDVDHFKAINDTFGHQVGDEVLCWFASRLREAVRASDTVARLGGDEFTIILEGMSGEGNATRVAEKILYLVQASDSPRPDGKAIGTSIGIAIHEGDAAGPEDLLHRADSALYRSKQRGRGRYTMA